MVRKKRVKYRYSKKKELIVTTIYSLLVDPNQAKNKLVRLVARKQKWLVHMFKMR